MLNCTVSPIVNVKIEDYLTHKTLCFRATLGKQEVYVGAEFISISTPSDYDTEANYFTTKYLETVSLGDEAINTDPAMLLQPPTSDTLTTLAKFLLSPANLVYSPR